MDDDSPYLTYPEPSNSTKSKPSNIPLSYLKRQLSRKNYSTPSINITKKNKSSPQLKTYTTDINEISNEKYPNYTLLIVHLHFYTSRYSDIPSFDADVMTLGVNVDNPTTIGSQIRDSLLTLTTSNIKRHILIFSTSILQNEDHGYDRQTKIEFFRKDILILDEYNKCLQEYKTFNVIHDNITIYHCIIGDEVVYQGTYIHVPCLYPVHTKEGTPVFKRIRNFCSQKIDDTREFNPTEVKYSIATMTYYRHLKYINKNERWWEPSYNELSASTQGYLRQTSGTCWFNSILNLILLTPLSKEAKEYPPIKNAKDVTFYNMRNARGNISLQELLFSLLKKILLTNTLPKRFNGDILLPIAARVNALIYKGNSTLFNNIQYGVGSSRTAITTLEILKMFMEDKLISYIDTEKSKTIHRALSIMKTMRIDIPKKYILFCGAFTHASKEIMLLNKKYDLFGCILRLFLNVGRHAICGMIINGKECISDSNGRVNECIWSTCDINNFTALYQVKKISLINCVYILRNNE